MPDSFLPEFELYVLLGIARLGDDAYGAALREEIDQRTGRPVSVGALYATLARLVEKGLIEQEERGPEAGRRGRPRKYCRLTGRGEEAVRHSSRMLLRMMDGVPMLRRVRS